MVRRRRVPESIVVGPLWRRHPVAAVLGVILLGVVAYDRVWQVPPARTGNAPSANAVNPASVTTADFDRYHDRSFPVARVVDGDTIDLRVPDGDKPTTRVRLWGVDTPEVAGPYSSVMYFGQEASDYAKRILTGRMVHVVLSPRRTRGKYGRLLAYVYLQRGGRMFNEMLLETGHAYADTRFDHHYLKKFESLEKHARNVGVGLWASVTLEQMPPWRQQRERR